MASVISRPGHGEPADMYDDPAYESDLERWTATQSSRIGKKPPPRPKPQAQ